MTIQKGEVVRVCTRSRGMASVWNWGLIPRASTICLIRSALKSMKISVSLSIECVWVVHRRATMERDTAKCINCIQTEELVLCIKVDRVAKLKANTQNYALLHPLLFSKLGFLLTTYRTSHCAITGPFSGTCRALASSR